MSNSKTAVKRLNVNSRDELNLEFLKNESDRVSHTQT